jgi:hypothetical protein
MKRIPGAAPLVGRPSCVVNPGIPPDAYGSTAAPIEGKERHCGLRIDRVRLPTDGNTPI